MVTDSNAVVMNGYAVSVSPSQAANPMFKKLPSAVEINDSKITLDNSDNYSGSSDDYLTAIDSTQQTQEVYEEMMILLIWGPNDRRFGFSVSGGSDEDHTPIVNKISFDSPATRAGLLLNDEIIEVNGISVSGMSHADVIMQIHKCKNKMTLKIRRCEEDEMSYDNYDGREMPIDVGVSVDEEDNSHVNHKPIENGLPQSGMLKYARTQPSVKSACRESNVPAKYYNEAFELDDNEKGEEPSKFLNEGEEEEGEGDQFVRVTSTRRIEIDDQNPKSFPIKNFVTLLELMEKKLEGSDARINLDHLRQLYFSENFVSAVKTHNYLSRLQIAKRNKQESNPVATNSLFLLTEVRLIIMEMTDPTSENLLSLISKPEMQQLLNAHDLIARRESYTDSEYENSDEREDEEGGVTEGPVKIVRIDKSNEPLGATVRNEGDAVIISRIVRGGAAEKSGVLHVGDEILEINEESMRGRDVNEVVELLAELDGTLTFVLVPSLHQTDEIIRGEAAFVVKALFDYDPETDDMLPCEELGLAFRKGDVLEILNQTDPDWWQARILDNVNRTLAGLIPSKPYQLQREAAQITLKGDDKDAIVKEKKRCFCGRRKRKSKKESRKSKRKAPLQEKEVLTYEDMTKFLPDSMRRRPVVLIGPQYCGRFALKKQLLREFPDSFASAVEHTTRLPSHEELSGLDYIFISRPEFEKSISNSEFIQYGEHEGNYYGVSFKSVRDVIDTGKSCLLNLNCTAVVLMKRMYLMPYVIFITLPGINLVKQLRELDESCEPFNPSIRLKESQLDEMIEEARDMNRTYGHLFDKTIVNSDFDQSYDRVMDMCFSLEKNPQWVSVSCLPN